MYRKVLPEAELKSGGQVQGAPERVQGFEGLVHDLIVDPELTDGRDQARTEQHGGAVVMNGDLLAEPHSRGDPPPQIRQRSGHTGQILRPALEHEDFGVQPTGQLPADGEIRAQIAGSL
jgi:hypothetical protein